MAADLTTVLRTLSERENDLKRIIEHYGDCNQSRKLMEEMAELQQAIVKLLLAETIDEQNKRWESYIEEFADVVLLMAQLMTFEIHDFEIAKKLEEKLDRQLKRIREE